MTASTREQLIALQERVLEAFAENAMQTFILEHLVVNLCVDKFGGKLETYDQLMGALRAHAAGPAKTMAPVPAEEVADFHLTTLVLLDAFIKRTRARLAHLKPGG